VAVAAPARVAARPRARLSAIPRPLAALLVACALLGLGWTLAMAPLQGPDEHNHVGYAQHLAETGTGPSFGATDGGSWSTEQRQWQSWQGLQALIGIVDARPGWNAAEEQRFDRFEDAAPAGARKDGGGPNPVAQNPPLYYAYEALPYWATRWAELPTRLLAMRLANLPLYLLLVTFAWLAAGEAFGRRRMAQTITAGSVGLLPQLGFMSGVVNPDFLLATIWAAFAWVALMAVRTGPRPRVVLALGGLAAASALTHGRGLAIVGPLVVVLAVILWRARPLSRRALLWGGGALGMVLAGMLVAFAYSSGHGGGASLGGEVGSTTGAGSPKGFLSYLWQFYLPPLRTMSPQGPPYGYRQVFVEGLGGTFGSLEIQFPLWVYDALQLAAALGLILLFALIVRRWAAVRARAAQLLVVVSLPVCMMLVLHLSAYRDLQGPPYDPLLTGRYLLPLLVPMGLAIAFACTQLPRRWGALLGTLVLTTFAVLSLCGLGLTVTRFYA
jgi:4-amino-4-deoxy-L-arabinose transferase-like glycosyltransferase